MHHKDILGRVLIFPLGLMHAIRLWFEVDPGLKILNSWDLLGLNLENNKAGENFNASTMNTAGDPLSGNFSLFFDQDDVISQGDFERGLRLAFAPAHRTTPSLQSIAEISPMIPQATERVKECSPIDKAHRHGARPKRHPWTRPARPR